MVRATAENWQEIFLNPDGTYTKFNHDYSSAAAAGFPIFLALAGFIIGFIFLNMCTSWVISFSQMNTVRAEHLRKYYDINKTKNEMQE
jgi:hypothetical protein